MAVTWREAPVKERKKCEECGKTFKPGKYWQRFCSAACQMRNWAKRHPRVKTPE